jgi:hypothetical protein
MSPYAAANKAKPVQREIEANTVDHDVIQRATKTFLQKIDRIKKGEEYALKHVTVKDHSERKATFALARDDGSPHDIYIYHAIMLMTVAK